MKKFLFIFIYLFFFNSFCWGQVSENSCKEFVLSLETFFELKDNVARDLAGTANKIKDESYTYRFHLISNQPPNNIKVCYSMDKTKIQDFYTKSMLMLPSPDEYQENIDLFSDFSYYKTCKTPSAIKKASCRIILYAYYENFYFHIRGDKEFVNKSILKICEELALMYN